MSIKGYIFDEPELLLEGKVLLEGAYGVSKYGKEFEFYNYKVADDSIVFFLTKIIGGISKRVAEDIQSTFGERFEEVLTHSPQELLEIKGIKQKKLAKILEKWEEKKHVKNLATALAPYGISNSLITKIYKNFGEDSLAVIKQNPYKLTEIHGVGFKVADIFARKLGLRFDSEERVQACIIYSVRENAKDGHTAIEKRALYELFVELSRVDEEEVGEDLFAVALDWLIKSERLATIFANGIYYIALSDVVAQEKYILKKIETYKKNSNEAIDATPFIEGFEADHGILFGEAQKEAISLSMKKLPIFSITGYAGSGKTTTARAILTYFENLYSRDGIVCCALSGIAANRIKKQSGFHSLTIHSLLSYDFATRGFKYNKEKPLPYKVVLLDEASMVDVAMFYHLLSAIDLDSTTFILLGDPAQLPPVGAGDVFGELVRSRVVENVTLDKIYRQSEEQKINLYAQDVRIGRVPNLQQRSEDFYLLDRTIPNYWNLKNSMGETELRELREAHQQKICDEISDIAATFKNDIKNLYKEDVWSSLTHFQLISPMKEGILGTKNLNTLLQARLNPQPRERMLKLPNGKEFHIKDKVVHLQNRNMNCFFKEEFQKYKSEEEMEYEEMRVYNGQIGVLFYLNKESDEYLVYYPNEEYIAIYTKSDFSGGVVDLAYALTIHKTQGSEFANVLIPLSTSHYMMLNNKLLYTAMTRAKEKLCIIGERYAFEIACKRSDELRRVTVMQLLLGESSKR